MNEDLNDWQDLDDAMAQRAAATSSCHECGDTAYRDDNEVSAARSNLNHMQQTLDGHIAAGAGAGSGEEFESALARAVATRAAILRATITLDMAQAKAQKSRGRHLAAIAVLRVAEAAVDVANSAFGPTRGRARRRSRRKTFAGDT